MIKRCFDAVAAFLGLFFLSPLFLILALLVKIDSKGPVFFRQERVGKAFQPFFIYKFRSMVRDAPRKGGPITFGDDPRITQLGKFLRWTKLDELPQLVNVLKGEMSFVGPRPEVKRYVEMFREDYAEILTVRPGVTDLASVRYRNEAEILGRASNPEEEYIHKVLPEKIRLAKEYIRNASFTFDLKVMFKTVCSILKKE